MPIILRTCMKVVLFISLLSVACLRLFAQNNPVLVYNKWCARQDTLLLFPTGNNLVQVVAKEVKAEDLQIKSLDNALKIGQPEIKGDTISFLAMPYPKYGKKMRLAITERKTRKNLTVVNFYPENEPNPIAQVSNLTTDHALKSQILAKPFLKVVFPNSLYAYPYKVKQYTFKTRVNGKDVEIPWKGPAIGASIQSIIKDLPEGAFIEFTDIKATCPDCIIRDLAPLKLWIK